MTSTQDNSALTISIIALIVSVLGWVIAYWLGIRATNIGRQRDFQLKTYQGLLDRTNKLIKDISSYTTHAMFHRDAMARLLDEYVANSALPITEQTINKKYDLQVGWINAIAKLAEEDYTVSVAMEDYLRYLDMNGTDYTNGTKLYDGLNSLKVEARDAAERNRQRWSDYSEMDTMTISKFTEKSDDTAHDVEIIFGFGMCTDDVLLHMYNASIANYLGKPKKKLNMQQKRRYLTEEGIVDKRIKSKGNKS